MTKAQKIWICCLKQLGYILLNKKKQVWSINGPAFLTGKKQSNETRLFIRIPMEEECDLNAQFLHIILRKYVFFQKMLCLSPFSASY